MARRRHCRSTGRLRTYRTSGCERRLLQDLYGRISRWRPFSPFGKRRFQARYIVRATETGNLVKQWDCRSRKCFTIRSSPVTRTVRLTAIFLRVAEFAGVTRKINRRINGALPDDRTQRESTSTRPSRTRRRISVSFPLSSSSADTSHTANRPCESAKRTACSAYDGKLRVR